MDTALNRSVKKILKFLYLNSLISSSNKIYTFIINHFSWWPINLYKTNRKKSSATKKHIAYYLWRYPLLSETFIQREIIALAQSGLLVEVIADNNADLENLDEKIQSLASYTHYLFPINKKLLLKYFFYFFLRNPLMFTNLLLYTVFHKYHNHKTIREDALISLKAINLAGVLKDKKINHVHSPWADVNSFIALIASKLLRIPYTIQARAHDIHRKTSLYGFSEKFLNADFVITNSQYNRNYLKSFLDKDLWKKIHIIYNGINLEQFDRNYIRKSESMQFTILSVARLIEQKGIVYLLKACKILRDRGYLFRCNIIGGPEEPIYTNYYIKLKKMHKQLELEEHVFYLGAKPFDEVLEEYKRANIFILPCVIAEDASRDVTPNVLIEAMAMKLPVISTKITGIPEIVEDGISGILVPPNDEYALAEAMIKLINNEKLRKVLGENARKKVEERFNIQKNVSQYIELFDGTS